MWSCLRKLQEGLSYLRHYLDGLDKEDQLLSLDFRKCGDAGHLVQAFQQHFRSKNNKLQYEYNTIIISLYGYLERYIEDLIAEHLVLVSTFVPGFHDLPDAVQQNHLDLSLELTRKAEFPRYAGTLRAEDIIAKLHAC